MKYIIKLFLFFYLIHAAAIAQSFDDLTNAVMQKDTSAVLQMLNSGMNINTRDDKAGTTVLMVASSYEGYSDMINFLLAHGAEINAQSSDGKTALMWAAGNATDNVETLLNHKANVHLKANDGMTAFLFAVFGVLSDKVSTTVCDLLLRKKADINAELTSPSALGWTALHYAVVNGDAELVKYLVRNGANVNHKSGEGSSALFLANQNGYNDIVKILIKAGALE